MAKKITIDIEVNGKMQKATISAKKLRERLDDVDKSQQKAAGSAKTYDRNTKGAAQASSNASKNFSKMQQGMGGLVGAYASLAASLFAVSAAFNFLKGAGELKALQAGQAAYASATGIALKSLTNDIVEATNAQIAFRDAAQAAAIGTAAGLNADQLTRLGKAANDASQILGRDVTDSFNRLVRGVTKAEPELLDELGIILRLEDATREYGLAIDKAGEELTPFERSQAVVNDVLAQAEKKYSEVLDIVGRSPNQYAQLGKAFDDIVMKIQKLVDVVVGPLAKVLQDTPSLAIASFLLLLRGPLAAMGISFADIANEAKKSADLQVKSLEKVQQQAKLASNNLGTLQSNFQKAGKAAKDAGAKSPIISQVAEGDTLTKGPNRANLKKALGALEKDYIKHGIVTKGIFKGLSAEIALDMQKAFQQMELAEQNKLSKTQIYTTQATLHYTKMATAIKTASAAILNFGVRILNFAGYLGIAITAFQLLRSLFIKEEDTEKTPLSETVLEGQRKKIADLNKELINFAQIQGVIARGTTSAAGFGNIANVLSSIDSKTLTQTIKDFKQFSVESERVAKATAAREQPGSRGRKARRAGPIEEIPESATEANKFFQNIITTIDILEKETGRSFTAFTNFKNLLEDPGAEPKTIQAAAVAAMELGSSINELPKLAKDATAQLRSFQNTISPKSGAQNTLDALEKQADALEVVKEGGGLSNAQTKTLERLRNEIELIDEFRQSAQKSAERQLNTQIKLTNEVVGQAAGSRALREAQNAVTASVDKQLDIEQKINDIVFTKKALADGLEQDDINALEKLTLELELEQKIAGILETKRDLAKDLETIRNEQERLGLEQSILQVEQKVTQELQKQAATRQKIQDIATQQARADMEQSLAVTASGPFGYINQERRELDARIKFETELLKQKEEQIVNEVKRKMDLIDIEYDLLEAQFKLEKERLRTIEIQNRKENPGISIAADNAINAVDAVIGTLPGARRTAQIGVATEGAAAIADLVRNIDKLKLMRSELEDINVLTDGVAKTFEEGMSSAFNAILSGTKSAKQAFADMARSIVSYILQMTIKMLIFRAITGNLFGGSSAAATAATAATVSTGTTGTTATITPGGAGGAGVGGKFFRYGGVMEKSYATGGIARGPDAGYLATLHGTEAVVPLPNGREIPVQLTGAGQQNNVTVNVAVDNQGNAQTNVQNQEGQAKQLGVAISAAVQQELAKQKRAGGMLSPYLVA
jgi:hypothetical protein